MSGSTRVLTLLASIALAACAVDEPNAPERSAATHAAEHAASPRATITPAELNKQLAQLRQSTAPYHNFDKADEANYKILFDPDGDGPGSACLSDPKEGAMGEHFVNGDLLFDGGELDVSRPEALIYEPMKNGKYRLVAVEYVIPFSDRPQDGPAPTLFGQAFMPNDKPGFHLWALHVWIWEDNPSGMFAPYNPRVSCRYSKN